MIELFTESAEAPIRTVVNDIFVKKSITEAEVITNKDIQCLSFDSASNTLV